MVICAINEQHEHNRAHIMNENTVNVSAYRFVQISRSRLPEIRQDLLSSAQTLKLKGTVLLSTEGINLFVAGPSNNIESFFHKLNTYTEFFDLPRKDSLSNEQPFTRMLVRIKKVNTMFFKYLILIKVSNLIN